MPKKLIEIASEIVQAQVSLTPMTAADITSSLRQVFGTLHELQKAESQELRSQYPGWLQNQFREDPKRKNAHSRRRIQFKMTK